MQMIMIMIIIYRFIKKVNFFNKSIICNPNMLILIKIIPFKNMNQQIIIIQPDDMHVHFRDGSVLINTVQDTAKQFGKCMVMPNLKNPIVTTELALEYYQRIKKAIKNKYANFMPYMTLYLTNNTQAGEVQKALDSEIIKGFKLYPAGATTLSENGVTDITKCYKVFEEMQKLGLVLLLHGEVTDKEIDIFDREAKFIDNILIPLRKKFPELKISFEHITTKNAVDYIKAENSNYLAATITAHHLLYNRNDMLVGGIKPHYYCLPILKRSIHQQSLLEAATSGNSRFFAGTDSAPHSKNHKESSCGCAGCYTALHALELYTTAFDNKNALDKLEGFMSIFGSQFYNLPINEQKITLIKQNWEMPKQLNFGEEYLIPLNAGEIISWKIKA